MVGPERNARLTALTGVVLLVLLAIEGFTLLSLRAMLSWHIFVGVLVVPVVGLKLGSTGYRFFRYYTHRADYVEAGPPNLLLRLLGPVVILTTVALLATGIALIVVGPGRGLVLNLHKASFIVWFAALGAHVLGHLAVCRPRFAAISSRDPLGGSRGRLVLVAGSVVIGRSPLWRSTLGRGWLHCIRRSTRLTEGARMSARKGSQPKKHGRSASRSGSTGTTSPFDVDEFRRGMDVELEHGLHDPATNVTGDDPVTTGKIARAHLNEFPDYYTRLEQMEEQAKRELGAT